MERAEIKLPPFSLTMNICLRSSTLQNAGINNLNDLLYQFQNGILIPNLMFWLITPSPSKDPTRSPM